MGQILWQLGSSYEISRIPTQMGYLMAHHKNDEKGIDSFVHEKREDESGWKKEERCPVPNIR